MCMTGYFILIIQLLNVIAISYMVFKKREEPIYVIAWMMLMSFIPLLGFVFYILIGRGPIVKKKHTFIDELDDKKFEDVSFLQAQAINEIQSIDAHYLALIKFNLNSNKSLLTQHNQIKRYSEAKDKYKDLIVDILRAKSSVNMVYFIIRNDCIGHALLEALTLKAREGVKVRLVYDDGGSFFTPYQLFKPLIDAGGIVVKHYPAKFKVFTLNWNYRNHRKIAVIDGLVGYMGGMNIGDEYLSLHEKFSPWKDAHLRLEGDCVAMLQTRFFKDYFAVMEDKKDRAYIQAHLSTFYPPHHIKETAYIQIVTDGPDQMRDNMKAAYIKMITLAEKSIYIQSPYFIPDREFLNALKIAAQSGIDVRVMISSVPDNHFVHRTTTSYVSELIEVGIHVYFYQGFLHAKTFIIDEIIATVGSVNMDVRSFSINFEITAFIYDRNFSRDLTSQFFIDLNHCRYLDERYEKSKSNFQKGEESVYRLLSMLM